MSKAAQLAQSVASKYSDAIGRKLATARSEPKEYD